MGGWGSGRYRHSATTTGESKRVDIRFIRKEGWLYDGRIGVLSWTCWGEPSGTVHYYIRGDTFTLDYKAREPGGEWESIKLPVPLTTTPCQYGGNRYYFLCPGRGCGRRCEVLYSAGLYFVCRKCAGLIYDSQKGGEIDKLIEAKHKLGKRIFESYDGWGSRKKKGMHWKTFERRYAKYQAYDRMINAAFVDRFGLAEVERYGVF
jgi:hypothetical protein